MPKRTNTENNRIKLGLLNLEERRQINLVISGYHRSKIVKYQDLRKLNTRSHAQGRKPLIEKKYKCDKYLNSFINASITACNDLPTELHLLESAKLLRKRLMRDHLKNDEE